MNGPFTLDKDNGKLMGVCAGIARSTNTDVTLIRLLAVLSSFMLSGLVIPLYFVAGLVAPAAQ